jgi:uncharacterized protein YjbJ (UPF0337 family)
LIVPGFGPSIAADDDRRPVMNATTDKIFGRAKQALGAITGDKKMKREGRVQEHKSELKDTVNTTIDKTQDALEDLKKTVDRS